MYDGGFTDIEYDNINKKLFMHCGLADLEGDGKLDYLIRHAKGHIDPYCSLWHEGLGSRYRWDASLFSDMDQVKIISEKWMDDYNENHPHGSLGGKSPRQYARNNQPGFITTIYWKNNLKLHCLKKGKVLCLNPSIFR